MEKFRKQNNHFVLGGENREYLEKKTGRRIRPLAQPVDSIHVMDLWCEQELSAFDAVQGRLLPEVCFVQAHRDCVSVLEIKEDVWSLGEYFGGDIERLIDAFFTARKKFAPNTQLRLQAGLSRHCDVKDLQQRLEPFWGRKEFYSLDLYGDEAAQPAEKFAPIYRRAKQEGLRLKTHLGEFGTAEDIRRGVEILELDEVLHGIAAASEERVIQFLRDRHIRHHLTPTSNRMLGRVGRLTQHPITTFLRSGVEVTINSDDVLIFDSNVSKEYLRLYQAGVLTAKELDGIRLAGLRQSLNMASVTEVQENKKQIPPIWSFVSVSGGSASVQPGQKSWAPCFNPMVGKQVLFASLPQYLIIIP